jgi:hypothetical protein
MNLDSRTWHLCNVDIPEDPRGGLSYCHSVKSHAIVQCLNQSCVDHNRSLNTPEMRASEWFTGSTDGMGWGCVV